MPTPIVDTIAAEQLAIPSHLAIVMDGNGRWATERGLPRIAGHLEGRRATKRAITACSDLGMTALSLYAFSTENWGRPQDEVEGIMSLIEKALYEEMDEMVGHNVRFRASGRLQELAPSMQQAFEYGRKITSECTGLMVNLCVNYGGRAELVDAMQTLGRQVAAGSLRPEDIDEQQIQDALYNPALPDVELFLRPGREMRVSNFLLWQIAYAEIVVMDVLWPDFGDEHLLEAIRMFNKRQRRFGQVVEV